MGQPEGYFFLDHRASPGLPEEVAKRAELDPHQCRGGRIFEAATKRCCHCAVPVILRPERIRPRGHCFKCNDYVCDLCTAKMNDPDYVHVPWSKLVDVVKDAEAKGIPILGDPRNLLR